LLRHLASVVTGSTELREAPHPHLMQPHGPLTPEQYSSGLHTYLATPGLVLIPSTAQFIKL